MLGPEPFSAQNPFPSGKYDAGFGLYLHWPFCAAKCPYCDFNSHVAREIDHPRWKRAFLREIERAAALTEGRRLDSIYWGGGTPSLMPPELVDAVLVTVQASWALADDIEITLEANPSSVEASRFREYVGAGINRFSVGVQALNDADLKRLGRLHSAQEALAAVEIARDLCDRVSFDLIYARQDQSTDAWRSELARALDLGPDHLSLYQLTIEDGTAFGARHQAGKLHGLPGQELAADLYEITQEMCDAAGLPAYEVSNHARPGAEGRHNMVYWRYGDYVGVGPGAHGRLGLGERRMAVQCELEPDKWLEGVEGGLRQHEHAESLPPEDQGAEYLMMSLRLREGCSPARYLRLAGRELPAAQIDQLHSDGLLWTDGDRIGTTPAGRMVLNSLLRELL